MSPSEAAKARWERQRERDAAIAAAESTADEGIVQLIRVPIHVGGIMKQLDTDSRKGSVQAARELRSWLDRFPPEEAITDVAALLERDKEQLLAMLIALLDAPDIDAAIESLQSIAFGGEQKAGSIPSHAGVSPQESTGHPPDEQESRQRNGLGLQ